MFIFTGFYVHIVTRSVPVGTDSKHIVSMLTKYHPWCLVSAASLLNPSQSCTSMYKTIGIPMYCRKYRYTYPLQSNCLKGFPESYFQNFFKINYIIAIKPLKALLNIKKIKNKISSHVAACPAYSSNKKGTGDAGALFITRTISSREFRGLLTPSQFKIYLTYTH